MATYVWKWNGSAWVVSPFKKWNGSAWVDATVWKWGSNNAWIQIYPDIAVQGGNTIDVPTDGMSNWRTTWSNWGNKGEARQGNGSQYGGSAAYYGYMNLDASSFAGSGKINSITSATFTGLRGDSGYYNKNQSIKFYRSNVIGKTSGSTNSPVGTTEGLFTCQTGAPGMNKMMNNRPIDASTYGNLMNWLNKVGGKSKLYIYSNLSDDYLDIKSAKFSMNYAYATRSLIFPTKESSPIVMSRDVYRMETGKNPYFSILAYEGEENMSLEEILRRREDGIVSPIDKNNLMVGCNINPWTREYDVYFDIKSKTKKIKIEVFNMGMNDEAQYSIDGNSWNTLIGTTPDDTYLYGNLPEDFNTFQDGIRVRVINKEKDSKYLDLYIEPKSI